MGALADGRSAPRLQLDKPPVVTLDIERLPGRASVKHSGLTIEGDFWDLSGWKHVLGGRRIHPDDVLEWPRTICVAWRWYGNKRVEFASEWDDGRDMMLQRAWDVYDAAKVVVGHNVDAFDGKTLDGECWLAGMPRWSPVHPVDTLKVARTMRIESNTLDSLCKRRGIKSKTDKYNVAMARAAVAGDKAKQRQLRAYNVGDIDASEALYDDLRGRIPNHPHLRDDGNPNELSCPNCVSGEDALSAIGTTTGPSGRIAYLLYRCTVCFATVKDTKQHARTARTAYAR